LAADGPLAELVLICIECNAKDDAARSWTYARKPCERGKHDPMHRMVLVTDKAEEEKEPQSTDQRLASMEEKLVQQGESMKALEKKVDERLEKLEGMLEKILGALTLNVGAAAPAPTDTDGKGDAPVVPAPADTDGKGGEPAVPTMFYVLLFLFFPSLFIFCFLTFCSFLLFFYFL
jgi:hypothetical protein